MPRSLSEDVRLVIDTLGFVIRALGGDEVYGAVEAIRLAAKEAREADAAAVSDAARERLAGVVASLDAGTALEVARAFTLYFQLVNLAEDAQRTRELRRREMAGGPASVADSIHGVMATLANAGATREQVLDSLRATRLTFVFTAHPTEARRQTTERLLADVARILRRSDRYTLTELEVAAADRRLRAAIEALLQHAAERTDRPDVLDEVRAGLWYLEHSLLDVVPRFQRRLRHAFEDQFGPIDPLDLPVPVAFGSWMGGDRDGNPFVTPDVTARTMALHRSIVLERYERDLGSLIDPLAAAAHRLPDHPDLHAALARAAGAVPELAAETTRRNPREPLRRLLTFAIERTRRARTFETGGYASPAELVADLVVMRDVQKRADARALPDDSLLDLIQRVRVFGFRLAALDVREDSRRHGDPDIADLFVTLRRLHERFGPDAMGAYVISMTQTADDVLAVLRLAAQHGIADDLDIVPLLETPDDLSHAATLLDTLFRDESYARHLDRRGRRQELLVGYSDSMKEGGMLASRVGVAEAQRAAAGVCARHDVRLRVFHGRGGSVSRGGGPTHRAILALPDEAFTGEARITEQGEMRAHNFANPDLAVRYLEQSVGAALRVLSGPADGSRGRPAGEAETLAEMAATSQAAYRALLEDPRLVPYFQSATPFEQIASLNIASRPARRPAGAGTGVAGLRAIPWVFSWSQSRHVLTGWFGVGAALAAALDQAGGEARLRELYRASRFFRDLIDNVEMALSKADLPIASRYAALCSDPDVRTLFAVIEREFHQTVDGVLHVTGRAELLADDPVLARSIRLRNPYVDPLSYLQIEALRRLRDGAPADDAAAWARVARVAIQGIAAGIRHTG
jgi:phosphoenolpyruvate carboxylase